MGSSTLLTSSSSPGCVNNCSGDEKAVVLFGGCELSSFGWVGSIPSSSSSSSSSTGGGGGGGGSAGDTVIGTAANAVGSDDAIRSSFSFKVSFSSSNTLPLPVSSASSSSSSGADDDDVVVVSSSSSSSLSSGSNPMGVSFLGGFASCNGVVLLAASRSSSSSLSFGSIPMGVSFLGELAASSSEVVVVLTTTHSSVRTGSDVRSGTGTVWDGWSGFPVNCCGGGGGTTTG